VPPTAAPGGCRGEEGGEKGNGPGKSRRPASIGSGVRNTESGHRHRARHAGRATSWAAGSIASSLVGDTLREARAGVFFTALLGAPTDFLRLRVMGPGLTKGASSTRSSTLRALHSSSTTAALESVFSKPSIRSGFLALANMLRPGLASVRLPGLPAAARRRQRPRTHAAPRAPRPTHSRPASSWGPPAGGPLLYARSTYKGAAARSWSLVQTRRAQSAHRSRKARAVRRVRCTDVSAGPCSRRGQRGVAVAQPEHGYHASPRYRATSARSPGGARLHLATCRARVKTGGRHSPSSSARRTACACATLAAPYQ